MRQVYLGDGVYVNIDENGCDIEMYTYQESVRVTIHLEPYMVRALANILGYDVVEKSETKL